MQAADQEGFSSMMPPIEASQGFSTRAWFDSLDPNEKRNYMFNNETQEVIDLRTLQPVEQSTVSVIKGQAWKDYWKTSQKHTFELLKACKRGSYEDIQLLLAQNSFVDINAKDGSDCTCLHYACQLGQDKIAALLLQHGASVNEQDTSGRTPLHLSVLQQYKGLVQLLLFYKANPDQQDYNMDTPIHIAVEKNNIDIIELLLKAKADPTIQNNNGLTPLQLITNTDQLKVFERFKYQKQMSSSNTENSISRTISTTESSKENCGRKSVTQIIMKFFGKEVSSKELQNEPNKQNNRTSAIQIGGHNITTKSFTYHKELGKGSFGTVYLVRKKDDPNSLYAMKVLKKEKISQKLLPYIQTEKSILGVVDHPFIVKLHFAFQNETKLFLVMDFCSGGDLTKLLDLKNRLSEEVTRMYVAEIILALEALHKNKIMYRDMKPQNIIIDSQGHCMLTDFGLAKTDIDDTSMTKSFCGTPAYMAPEVVAKKIYSRSVDWYQLGTITHEMLYGIPPYYSHDRQELFENIKSKPLKFPSQIVVSQEAKTFMSQLLERNPTKRLGAKKDAEELKQHPWFKTMNWEQVYEKKLPVPQPSFVNQPNAIIEVNFDEDDSKDAGGRRQIDNWTFIS